jgi:hypothetical protein
MNKMRMEKIGQGTEPLIITDKKQKKGGADYVHGSLVIGILKRSKIARIFLERVGVFLEAPPPPPPPKKMEVTYKQLEDMLYKDVQEGNDKDDFNPNIRF